MSLWLGILSGVLPTNEVIPLWSWDFSTQGNSGWSTSTGGSGGSGTISWSGSYYTLTAPATSNAIYAAIIYNFADFANPSNVYLYCDQQKVNSNANIQDATLSSNVYAGADIRKQPLGSTRNILRYGPWSAGTYPTIKGFVWSNVSTQGKGTCTVRIYRAWVINGSDVSAFESEQSLPLQVF